MIGLELLSSNLALADWRDEVKELKIGNYSVLEDKIINNEIVGLGRKKLTEFEKWFSSTDLISFCVAEYE